MQSRGTWSPWFQRTQLIANCGKSFLKQVGLHENRDPVVKILGRSFATALERENTQADTLGLVDKVKDPSKDSETKVKLCLLLQNMDKPILSKLREEISEKVSLDPTAVKNEVELLKQLCSEGEKRVLKSLRYTSDFEFSNGYRTPLWRQAHGDICYLVIEPCDTETLYITYSTAGVFLNEGIKQEGEESGYERTSDVYADLVTLLKSRSPHFAENMNKQDFAEKPPSTHKCQHVESVDGEEQGQPQRSYEQQKKNVHEKTMHQHKAFSRNRYGSPCFDLLSMYRKTSAGAIPVEHESSTESEEEEEQPARRPEGSTVQPPDYFQIQNLVKYLEVGDQKATVLALCAMMDLNLMEETCQLAIRDLGGLQILLNLLDTKEVRCKIGSLKILRKMSHSMQISRTIVDMRGLQRLVKTLESPNRDLQALSAETIANVARFHRARKIVRNLDGIQKLVKLLDCGTPNLAQVSANQEKDVEVARCGVLALWSCSKSRKNKEAIRKAGGIPLLGRLLKSPHVNMLIPVVGTLQECSSEESYRITIQTEGMVKDLVKNLRSDDDELQMHCASAIFKCAEEKETRDLVRKYKGLQQLVSLLDKAHNKQLLAAATGAIWKCSISTDNVAEFQKHNALQTLVGLLTDQPEEVLVNVAGALGEFAQVPAIKPTIGKCGGIKPLVNLLIGTNQALLVNVTKALGACATDKDNMAIIQQLDGVRLVWSLLKKPSPDVQSSAAWALCACIENAKDSGEMVRSLIGGLELILNLLKSTSNEVLASVCAAIAKIARDEENLTLLTALGVIPLLAKLTDTTDDRLRHHLAEAIYYCCMWGNNRESFGEAQAVAPLVRFLKSKDTAVHLSTAKALYQLSWVPENIITMYKRGVMKPLMQMMLSDVEELQEYAALCVRNIRKLRIANIYG
ncbi:outer dynein arm-docking complex subunit 2 isoform X2 [Acanthochromis polyacanthus]|uniref:outer dynein arm-docking complex subunit 2 isoform X2 n=1 Tax=Acanthochromis polyacanthus TaxID=80966 RepID=UPI0022341B48|nr:outer dynein arm-docking complex subunit 2 isoform X2 [Acanthochromis polyacanthus]